MNLSKAWIAPALLAVCTSVPAVSPDPLESQEAWETRLDVETAGRLLALYDEAGPGLELPSEWTTLDRFAKGLPKMYASRLPDRDAWGERFLVGALQDRLIVLSKGENGVADTVANFRKAPDGIPRLHAVGSELFGDDIVLVVGEGLVHGPRTLLARQMQTMADLRSIATAVESFAIDNNFYPGQPDGLRDIETIRGRLQPLYIRTLPMEDGWGNPFLYWSDENGYVIVSAGADGTFDPAWRDVPPPKVETIGPTTDPNADIVFADGQFVQWPEGKGR